MRKNKNTLNIHTWKWTNLANDGSAINTWCKYEQIILCISLNDHICPGVSLSSSVSKHASNNIWTAALSWPATNAVLKSSLSVSFDNWPIFSVNGLSCICLDNWDREAANAACNILKIFISEVMILTKY